MPQSINDKDGDILSHRSQIPKRWHRFLKIVSYIILCPLIGLFTLGSIDLKNMTLKTQSFFLFLFEVIKFSVKNVYNLYIFILRAPCAISLKYLEYKIY